MLKAPFVWYGGKSRAAPLIWERLGPVPNYVEPFAGALGCLLQRPHPPGIETINDLDGFVANAWRSLIADPEATAHWADWPVSECVPRGTMIATPDGDIPVENIRPGMLVWGEQDGHVIPTRVLATKQSHAFEFYDVGPLSLTGNHPVWTQEAGYIPAKQLTEGMHIAMISTEVSYGHELFDMRNNVSSASQGRQVLFEGLQRKSPQGSATRLSCLRDPLSCATRQPSPTMLLAELRETACMDSQPLDHGKKCSDSTACGTTARSASEAPRLFTFPGQPYLQSCCPTQGSYHATRAWICPSKRRAGEVERTTAVARRTAGMGNRSCCSNASVRPLYETYARVYAARSFLHAGHCRATLEDRHRNRWQQSSSTGGKNEGSAARSGIDCVRMARFTLQKPPSPDRLGWRRSQRSDCREVYNFQTTTGNYFAERILTHNCDLHARHLWLRERRASLSAQLMGDPDYYDPKIAGWWLWGIACWIGGGWCGPGGVGPWGVRDGQLVHLGEAGQGVKRQRVHLGNAGQGVTRRRVHLGGGGSAQGVTQWRDDGALVAYFRTLQARLRHVRVCCGDWLRVLGPSVTDKHGLTGILLDPPYSAEEDRDMNIYAEESGTVAHDVRAWCATHGDNPLLRIVLCGYGDAHDALLPHGWRKQPWKSAGGYGSHGDGRGRANASREMLWCSPACLLPAQGHLFT